MNFSQRVGLLLSGTVALNFWSPAWAKDKDASATGPTVPVHEAPAQSWPEPPKAPAGAPNVVLILIDDVGFGATSAFGGPISTPNFERLADSGLRYNSFHVKLALLTHACGAAYRAATITKSDTDPIAEWSAPFPGYNTVIPKSSATIAEVLRETAMHLRLWQVHNTPMWQVSPAGPFDAAHGSRFEHFYGFIQAADSQYYPRIYRDITPAEPAKTPKEGYTSRPTSPMKPYLAASARRGCTRQAFFILLCYRRHARAAPRSAALDRSL